MSAEPSPAAPRRAALSRQPLPRLSTLPPPWPGADLPVTTTVDGFYAEVQAAGGNRFDTSSLITRLGKK